ncbi:carboxypeptidase regulatory-like domain-containing protein [Pseudonocardia phyllosphaerae]|uniref:carboxypeptidase regulatory-like domain-containing protein n=1 Tax=Pseudonocardia phyllosphaerae TaxID=3390502 RepID=UPI00397AD18C
MRRNSSRQVHPVLSRSPYSGGRDLHTPAGGRPTGGDTVAIHKQQGVADVAAGTPGIAGTVHRRDGVSGVGGAVVTVTDLDGRQHGRTASADDGTYAVGLPTGGTYVVVVAAPGAPPQAALVAVAAGTARHDVALAGGAVLDGALRDAAGAPVPSAGIALIDALGDVVASGAPGPDGRFRLVAPGAGPHTLTVTVPGHQPIARSVTLDAAGTSVEIALPARAGLSGTVRSSSGGAVEGARVAVVDGSGTTIATTVTGPDGTYAFDDLPTGQHTLTASGYPPVVSVVQVEHGATTPVEVRFPDPRGPADDRHGPPHHQGPHPARGRADGNGGPR